MLRSVHTGMMQVQYIALLLYMHSRVHQMSQCGGGCTETINARRLTCQGRRKPFYLAWLLYAHLPPLQAMYVLKATHACAYPDLDAHHLTEMRSHTLPHMSLITIIALTVALTGGPCLQTPSPAAVQQHASRCIQAAGEGAPAAHTTKRKRPPPRRRTPEPQAMAPPLDLEKYLLPWTPKVSDDCADIPLM